jgi:hypothetical protein
MSLTEHIPTQAEIAARRARMGFAPAPSQVVRVIAKPANEPAMKAARRLNKERMILRLERLAEDRLLKEQPASPTVDPVAEMVANYREVQTPQGNKRIVETQHVVAAIAKRHGVTFNDIMGPGRKAKIVAARFEAIVTVAQLRHTWSLPQIGRFFGDRDHTTILHCIKKMAVQTGETIKGYTPEEAAYLLDRQRDKNRDAIKTYRSKRNAKVAS